MDSPGGNGVAKRTPAKPTYDSPDTKMKGMGKEFGGSQRGSLAMGTAPGGQAGDHESKHETASDGITTKMGKEWPRPLKNTGNGVAEPFGNDQEGELEAGTAPKGWGQSDPDNGGEFERPKSIGEWHVHDVSSMMENNTLTDGELQEAFNSYAGQAGTVTLEGFAEFLTVCGAEQVLDESSLVALMERNADYMFHETVDSDGVYWLAESLPEALKKHQFGKKGEKGDGADCDSDSEECDDPDDSDKPAFLTKEDHDSVVSGWLDTASRIVDAVTEGRISDTTARNALQTSFNVRLSRSNISECSRDVRDELTQFAREYALTYDKSIQTLKETVGFDPNDPMAGHDAPPHQGPGRGVGSTPGGLPGEVQQGEPGGDLAGMDGPYGPEQGGPEQDLYGPEGQDQGFDAGMDQGFEGQDAGMDQGFDAGMDQGFDAGMDQGFDEADPYGDEQIGAADLPGMAPVTPRQASPQQPRRYDGGYQESRRGPGRRPLNEDLTGSGHVMDFVGGSSGSAADGKPSSKHGLPEEDTDMEELKGKDLLGVEIENSGDGQVEFTGGNHPGKLTGADGLKENVSRMASAVRRALSEDGHGLRGDFTMRFSTLVKTAGGRSRSPVRVNLSEALTDAEELVLFYGNSRVVLEAAYCSGGKVLHRSAIRLPKIARRGPVMSNNTPVFRFAESAEKFAGQLVSEGATCRVAGHNWGTAVISGASAKAVSRIFGRSIAG